MEDNELYDDEVIETEAEVMDENDEEEVSGGIGSAAAIFGLGAVLGIVALSQVLPYLRAGFSLALGMSWKAGVAAEVIGLPDLTVGEHLYDAKVYLNTADLFAWTVAVVAVSVCLEALVGRALDAAVKRWEARP